jgi:hypothetical protein
MWAGIFAFVMARYLRSLTHGMHPRTKVACSRFVTLARTGFFVKKKAVSNDSPGMRCACE